MEKIIAVVKRTCAEESYQSNKSTPIAATWTFLGIGALRSSSSVNATRVYYQITPAQEIRLIKESGQEL